MATQNPPAIRDNRLIATPLTARYDDGGGPNSPRPDRRPFPSEVGMVHIKKILYPTDFSSYSNQAYLHAVTLAETHGASLTIVYVYAPNTEGGDRRHWRSQLEQIRPAKPGIPVHHVFLEGDPAGEIVRYGRDAGIDLIVMGTHGHTGLAHVLLGSVTSKIIRQAPCPVLTVRHPEHEFVHA